LKAWEEEATELFNALNDADIVQVEAYIHQNPPSAGAIGVLLLVAKDKFKVELAKSGGKGRVAKDLRQGEKVLVRSCWEAWKKTPNKYKSNAEFARDMLEKCEHLTSNKVIEDWCREWEKEAQK
jgi:hypothetical protein